jgi:hypothetical protein
MYCGEMESILVLLGNSDESTSLKLNAIICIYRYWSRLQMSYKHFVKISLVLGLTEPFDLEWV